ncbi:S8 family serine peptidase [Catellatospora methionotrophica]|uniref:S8 family serine peptidase n=1 Tax=Catellatospora methionotrophica TaxID=121620 RepID=UPI00340246C1
MARVLRFVLALALPLAIIGYPPLAQAADSITDGQWYHAFLNTNAAHRMTEGAGIKVAVIDSGVDATHPDLRGSILPGVDHSVLGPGDGRTDTSGHGTAMASLIVGHGRVQGIAPAAKIIPIRAFLADVGTISAQNILWAVEQKADVISISGGISTDNPLLRSAINEALRQNIVVVAAAGNRPKDKAVLFPAAIPGVIAVSAVDRSGTVADVSVSGAQIVLAAPGDKISVAYRGAWGTGSGTSNATAIVSGAVALIRGKYPDLSADQVVQRLTATVDDRGPAGRDPQYGYGVLNLVAALTTKASPSLEPDASSTTSSPSNSDLGSNRMWLWIAAVSTLIGILALIFVRSRRRG